MNRFAVLLLIEVLLTVRSRATIITDFNSINPSSFADGGTTWAALVNQFQFLTDGSITGQEVLPIGGGNPTVSGGEGRQGLSVDLSGNDGLPTARLLAGNQALFVSVLLLDGGDPAERFGFSAASFSAPAFSSAPGNSSTGTITAPGSTTGLDLSAIIPHEVQGNSFDLSGAATFDIHPASQRGVVPIPEPVHVALCIFGLLFFGFRQRFKATGA